MPNARGDLTKREAAARLQVTERTVEAFVKDGKLDPRRWRPQGGGQWRTVFLVEDVDRLVQERQGGPPTAFLVPPPAGPGNGNGHHGTAALQRKASDLPSMEDVLRAVVAIARQVVTAEAPKEGPKDPKGPKWLTLAEASAASGLSEKFLRRRIGDKTLKHRREPRSQWTATDRGWRIHRATLEAFR